MLLPNTIIIINISKGSFSLRYFPKSGGRVDFYSSGDASVVFNSVYSGQNTFFLSNSDVCIPSNLNIEYDIAKAAIIPSFSTYYSVPYTENSPTAEPTSANPVFKHVYNVGMNADVIDVNFCEPGEYRLGDCSCIGDSVLYLYDYYNAADYATTSNWTLLAYSDDDCGPFSTCSQIKYQYDGQTCQQHSILIASYSGYNNVKGELSITGPDLGQSLKAQDSLISCLGNSTTPCNLTCPHTDQDIVEINYALVGSSFWAILFPYELCRNSTASDILLDQASKNCIGQNSCSLVFHTSGFDGCDNDDDWTRSQPKQISVEGYCKKIRRRRLDLDNISGHHHRRLGSSSSASKVPKLNQPCKDDSGTFVLQVGKDIGFHDTSDKATSKLDVRSLSTVLAINSGLVKLELLTKTASFIELFGAVNSSNLSEKERSNFDLLKERDASFYIDPFYVSMDPILCAKVPLKSSSKVAEICSLIVADTVAVPVLSSVGLMDQALYYGNEFSYNDKMCIFQLAKQRCDRFNDDPKCELDFVKEWDTTGSGYNNYLLGLIYISSSDLNNTASNGQYLEWMDIPLNFIENDIDNYDDNFQSAAYKLMATYDFAKRFDDLITDDGSYNVEAHDAIMNSTFYNYYHSSIFPAYPSSTCPATYKEMIKLGFQDLCPTVVCRMMVMTYMNQNDPFSNYLGNYIGTGSTRFKPGDRASYYPQLYRPLPFQKIRDAPPQQLGIYDHTSSHITTLLHTHHIIIITHTHHHRSLHHYTHIIIIITHTHHHISLHHYTHIIIIIIS